MASANALGVPSYFEVKQKISIFLLNFLKGFLTKSFTKIKLFSFFKLRICFLSSPFPIIYILKLIFDFNLNFIRFFKKNIGSLLSTNRPIKKILYDFFFF